MYNPSENDLRFAIHEVLETSVKEELSAKFDHSPDLIDAILSEAARYNSEILAPLNHAGDQEGCVWNPQNTVSTPKGWKEAHKALGEQGWCGLEASEDLGGQGLSRIVGSAFGEMHHSGKYKDNANAADILKRSQSTGDMEDHPESDLEMPTIDSDHSCNENPETSRDT